MVPKIWRVTDIIFCHSGPFFALLPTYGPRKSKFWQNEKNSWGYYHFTKVYHKWQPYIWLWFLRYGVQQTEFFLSFWTIFCPFNPLINWKIKILKKWKKTPGDIIILYICTINNNHMIYGSWDMERDRQNFLSFWTIFCPFTSPLKTWKIKILKKWLLLHKCTKNHDHVLYCPWDMMRDGCNCHFSFWAIFCPFIPLTTQKMEI